VPAFRHRSCPSRFRWRGLLFCYAGACCTRPIGSPTKRPAPFGWVCVSFGLYRSLARRLVYPSCENLCLPTIRRDSRPVGTLLRSTLASVFCAHLRCYGEGSSRPSTSFAFLAVYFSLDGPIARTYRYRRGLTRRLRWTPPLLFQQKRPAPFGWVSNFYVQGYGIKHYYKWLRCQPMLLHNRPFVEVSSNQSHLP